jgi:hypothetical protein
MKPIFSAVRKGKVIKHCHQVIIFVIGTIIFLAIVVASSALKKNISLCKNSFSISCYKYVS